MAVRSRISIENLVPCVHGVMKPEEAVATGRKVIDFSASCNPFGPPPGLKEVLDGVSIGSYPDRDCIEFRRAVAAGLGCDMSQVMAANGSVELIWLVGLAYLEQGERVVIVRPTFGEYEVSAQIAGTEIVNYPLTAANGFRLDAWDLAAFIRRHKPKLVFLGNPNNPTGLYVPPDSVEMLLDSCPDTLFVVDEAYISFLPGAVSSIHLLRYTNIVILRSMTKDFALAGLRLGYGLGNSDVIGSLKKVQPAWSVNSLAQAAGVYCLSQDSYLQDCVARLGESKAFLIDGLSRLGVEVLPSAVNFLLLKAGDATAFRADLLRQGCCVRDCTSFGLPEYVRVGVRTMEECERLLAAIAEIWNA